MTDSGTSLGDVGPYLGIGTCYAATVLGGMALSDEVADAGLAVFANPGDVGNVGVFAVFLLVFTGVTIAAIRAGVGMQVIRLYMTLAFGTGVAALLAVGADVGTVGAGGTVVAGLPTGPISVAVTMATAAVLWVYPEWYVLDLVAVAAGAAFIPMLGLGFGPLPVVVLLVVWAGYDAYAVYVSGHMQELAEGVGSLRVPIVYVVPRERGFTLLDGWSPLGDDDGGDGDGDDDSDEDGEDTRPAMVLGLGDAVIPGILGVSAGQFLDAPAVVPMLNANLPALGALLGGVVGLVALFYLVHRVEGAHAGLPPLNAGVLGGYLLGAVAAGVPLTAALGL
jgi:presenilin-like A22 family membrane protease